MIAGRTCAQISVIGGGLAGCAAAFAAEAAGVPVTLYEQRPSTTTPTHQTALPAELAGTADLGVEDLDRATGLLKAELRALCPPLLDCADRTRIGDLTLAVDRARFAQAVAEAIDASERIELRREEVAALPDGVVVIASGPATWSPLARAVHAASGEPFRFSFIGRPPLVEAASIDLSSAFREAPYPGAEPVLFLPLTEEEAGELGSRLAAAERREPPEFDAGTVLAEESTTAERLAADPEVGPRRLLSGPRGPGMERDSPALRLTPDDANERAWHLEGLLTALPAAAQVEALQAVRAFAQVRLLRPGMVHRTPWIAGRKVMLPTLQLRRTPRALLAGTLTGAYGYVEAMALGAIAGIGAARLASGSGMAAAPRECLSGALCRALSEHEPHADGRMLRANFGMIPEHPQDEGLGKSQRRESQTRRALRAAERYVGGA